MTEPDDKVPTQQDLRQFTCPEDAEFILSKKPLAGSFAEYKQAMANYVELLWNVRGIGITLRELNQRFCQLGIRFGTKPSDVAQMLAREGLVRPERYKGTLVVFWHEYKQRLSLDNADADMRALLKESVGR